LKMSNHCFHKRAAENNTLLWKMICKDNIILRIFATLSRYPQMSVCTRMSHLTKTLVKKIKIASVVEIIVANP